MMQNESISPSAGLRPADLNVDVHLHVCGRNARAEGVGWRARWNHFWFRRTTPHILALFRIAFGGFLFVYFALQLPHVDMFFSNRGLLIPELTPDSVWTVIFTPPPLWAAETIFVAFLAFLALFTLGALTRVSSAVSFVLYVYYWILTLFQFGTSFDRLFLFSLLVLIFSGCGKAFSVDMRIKHGSWLAWEPISILAQRLLAVQVSATYLGVGWLKIVFPSWQTGKVLAVSFISRWATPPAWWIARLNIPLVYYDWMTSLIKLFEVTIPFGLWNRRTQWWYFAGGALFHIGIAILLDIWWFIPLIPAYILFLEPERVTKALQKIGVSDVSAP